MIAYGENIQVFCGNSNPQFAQTICKELGVPMGKAIVTHFADGEASVTLEETVRGADVFLIQSTCKPVNDNLMELLVMIDACRRASAGRITAVIPYFGYARQDRKAKSRDPISAKLVANMLTAAGADRILTMDLHAAQIQGFFDIPLDHLLGNVTFVEYFMNKFPESGYNHEDFVVVSPDVGSVGRARNFAAKVHMGLAIVDKRRPKANVSEVMNIIGDVRGKTCILYDDLVDTAGSLCNAAKALVEIGGAKEIYACATHGVLSGPAYDRIEASPIKEMVLLNTIDLDNWDNNPGLQGLTYQELKARCGQRPIGVYLGCPKAGSEDGGKKVLYRREGMLCTLEHVQKCVDMGVDFVILGGNPGSGTSITDVVACTRWVKEKYGDKLFVFAGKWEDGINEKVLGDPLAQYDAKDIIRQLIDAGADCIDLPAPGSRNGISVHMIQELVQYVHRYKPGTLAMTFLNSSVEGADPDTVRLIALKMKETGADVHAIGDGGFAGCTSPENIHQLSVSIKGRPYTYFRMASTNI